MRFFPLQILILGSVVSLSLSVRGEEPVEGLLEKLENPSHLVREEAWQRLNFKIQQNDDKEILQKIQNWERTNAPSFEVQNRLRTLTLPEEREISDTENIFQRLHGENYAERVKAERELARHFQDREKTYVLLRALRERIAAQNNTLDDRLRLLRLEKLARKAWLEQGAQFPKGGKPNVSEIGCWARQLARAVLPLSQMEEISALRVNLDEPYLVVPGQNPLGEIDLTNEINRPDDSVISCWLTLRKLEDALASDETRKTAEEALKEVRPTTPVGESLLYRMEILCQPCVASEYWERGKHRTSQFFQLGRKQHVKLMDRWAGFSQLTDTTVHCDNGYHLNPGFHPLNTAIPHPQQEAFFCLRNLALPRQKILYPLQNTENTHERLAAITARTWKKWITSKEPWAYRDVRMLWLSDTLDTATNLSQLMLYLRAVPDYAILGTKSGDDDPERMHTVALFMLFERGTRSVMPELLDHLRKNTFSDRLRAFQLEANWGWIAALEITRRDPWEGSDTWLESLLDRKDLLWYPERETSPMEMATGVMEVQDPLQKTVKPSEAATLGATAAGILCDRRGVTPKSMGLEPANPPNRKFDLPFYRYSEGSSHGRHQHPHKRPEGQR